MLNETPQKVAGRSKVAGKIYQRKNELTSHLGE